MIDTPEDVFHLNLNEIEQLERLPTPQLTGDLRSAVVRRKERRKTLEGTPLVDPRIFRLTEAPGDNLLRTNPSWTPLFQRAAAVVVDTGGSGSHAAIVAREYGIPAVMGTVDGTRRLKDGERIRVDGFHGSVYGKA